MKVGLYARVSTTDKGQDVETQLRVLRSFVERFEWEVYKQYTEQVSATKKRPILEEMLSDARQRYFDCLIVWKIDRLARSMVDFVNIIQELDRLGIRFISTSQNIDTDQKNPASRLMMNIIAAMAEFEKELIRERVNAGIARARAEGKHLGREWKVMDHSEIAKLRSEGKTIREICEITGQKRQTVFRRLKMIEKGEFKG